jgi:formate C-acetyltransferase
MGNDIDEVDAIATRLLDAYADSWKGRKNARGGVYRAGTGSAMYYLWHAAEIPASADGRLKQQPFPANYAPSLNVKVNGPLSVVKSFTKPHLQRVINGGPLTLELHDSTFREPDGIAKVARLVQYFAQRGGHQLQLNAVNRDKLLAAQAHPENYRNLIVRVWGWSGYFVELDKPYQDHVIKRVEMTM